MAWMQDDRNASPTQQLSLLFKAVLWGDLGHLVITFVPHLRRFL